MHLFQSSFTAVFSSRSKKKDKAIKDQNQAPDDTQPAAVTTVAVTTNHEITRSLTAYPTPTVIHYLSRPAPITIYSNPKPLGQFTYHQNQQTQVPVITTQQPGFLHRFPSPLPGAIDSSHPKPISNCSDQNTQGRSFRYQDEPPAPVISVVKKPYSNRTSPYATSAAISCSLRPKPLNHPRYGLSQSLVVRSAGFGSAGSVVVCGDREDQPTSYLQDDCEASNAEESEDEETEPVVELEQDDRPLPLPVLESWAEGCLDMAVSPYRQGPTKKEYPKLWDDQLTPPGPSDWVPTVPTKVEPLKWKPDHTAAGYLRTEQLDLSFEKLDSVPFQSLPPASLISEHFCHSGNSSQGQQSQATWSDHPPNSPPICMVFPTVFENDLDDLKPLSEDLSSARAKLQQADAKRNFAGARDLWRHHANMMGVEPETSIMNASSPVHYRRARVPQGPTVIRRPSQPVQVAVSVAAEIPSGFGVGEPLRRSAPIPIPIRRRARGLAYAPPLSTIPASPSTSPRDTPLSSKNTSASSRAIPVGPRVMPSAVQSEHSLKNRFKRPRMFRTAIRNVFRTPQRA